ncbi:MAG: hypothetical protein FVQ82_10240 [Planctomycetes bacterium]|nr:hypothetical protein [Planctomycetota bacterium]
MSRFIAVSLFLMGFGGFIFGGSDSWEDLDLSEIGRTAYYGDVSGDIVVYTVGPACDYTWDLKYKYLKDGVESPVIEIEQRGIDTQPRIDGDILVWCGGPRWKKPWTHEPSNFSVFARNLSTDKQITLREYTMSESYSHPAVSGNKVVWLEHLNLDPMPKGKEAKNWWNTSFNVCGADIRNIEKSVYFTIAKNVGKRDPYPCHSSSRYYDGVIDICGDLVVWEAGGDIFGADISDLSNIKVFTVCDDKGGQYNPVISGKTVVWTDHRNDGGDIYGASIADIVNIKVVAIIREKGSQKQPAIDSDVIVYVNLTEGGNSRSGGEIEVCKLSNELKATKIELARKYYGLAPSVHKNTIVWQGVGNQRGKAMGVCQIK